MPFNLSIYHIDIIGRAKKPWDAHNADQPNLTSNNRNSVQLGHFLAVCCFADFAKWQQVRMVLVARAAAGRSQAAGASLKQLGEQSVPSDHPPPSGKCQLESCDQNPG